MSIGGNVVYSEVTDSNGYAPVADVACDVEVSIQVNRVGFVETTSVSNILFFAFNIFRFLDFSHEQILF